MRQAEDTKTLELLPEQKEKMRRRGRPRVENPLSAAERAKRYREKRKAEGRPRRSIVSIGHGEPVVTNRSGQVSVLEREIRTLKKELELYRQFAEQRADLAGVPQRQYDDLQRALKGSNSRIADLTGALDEVIRVSAVGKRVPSHMLKGLVKLLAGA